MSIEETGVSFGKIVKTGMKRWKLLVAITAVVTLAGGAYLHFGFNKTNVKYNGTFNYNSLTLKDEYYIDGNPFAFRDLVSSETLNQIKESNSDYSNIDVNAMCANSGIVLTRLVTGSQFLDEAMLSYKITVKGKYFASKAQAKSFIADIANYPLKEEKNRLNSIVLDTALKNFDQADTYSSQINHLLTQSESLVYSYETMLKKTTSRSLQDYIQAGIAACNDIIDEDKAAVLVNEYLVGGFVKDYEAAEIKEYPSMIKALELEKTRNQEIIDSIQATIEDIQLGSISLSSIEEMVEYSERNAEITHLIADMNLQLSNKTNTDPAFLEAKATFDNTLASYRARLGACCEQNREVLKKVYIDTESVSFVDSGIVTSSGKLNIIVCAGIPLVLGFLGAFLVNLIIDRKELAA